MDLGGNAIDTTSAAGRFMLMVLTGAAEMERNLTRERTKSSMAVLAVVFIALLVLSSVLQWPLSARIVGIVVLDIVLAFSVFGSDAGRHC